MPCTWRYFFNKNTRWTPMITSYPLKISSVARSAGLCCMKRRFVEGFCTPLQRFQSGHLLSHLVNFTVSFMFVDIWGCVCWEWFLQPASIPCSHRPEGEESATLCRFNWLCIIEVNIKSYHPKAAGCYHLFPQWPLFLLLHFKCSDKASWCVAVNACGFMVAHLMAVDVSKN